jgi:hypothetical protein
MAMYSQLCENKGLFCQKFVNLLWKIYIKIDRGRGVCYIFSILRGAELLSFMRAFFNKENILGCHQDFFLEV